MTLPGWCGSEAWPLNAWSIGAGAKRVAMIPSDPSFCDRSPQRRQSLLRAVELVPEPSFLLIPVEFPLACGIQMSSPNYSREESESGSKAVGGEGSGGLSPRRGADPLKRVCSILSQFHIIMGAFPDLTADWQQETRQQGAVGETSLEVPAGPAPLPSLVTVATHTA